MLASITMEERRAIVAADRLKDLEKALTEAMACISDDAVEVSGVRDVMDTLQGKGVPARCDARVWLPQIEKLARSESKCQKVVHVVYNDVGIRAMLMAPGVLREHAVSDGSRTVRSLVVTLRKQLMLKINTTPTGSMTALHIDIFRWARNRQGWLATLTVCATELVTAALHEGGGVYTATQLLPTISHAIELMVSTTIDCTVDIEDMSSEVVDSLDAWFKMLAEANRIGTRASIIVVPHSVALVVRLRQHQLRTEAVRARFSFLAKVTEKLVVDHAGDAYQGDYQGDACTPSVGCWNKVCVNLEGISEDSLPLQRCAGCHVHKYCSSGCQARAWRDGHMDECRSSVIKPDEL